MTREEEILEKTAPLPTLSHGLRSRVLAAALEAQERQQQSRKVIAGSLSLFAILSWFSWRQPKSHSGGSSVAAVHDTLGASGSDADQVGLLSSADGVVDGVEHLEAQLQNRRDLFNQVHPM
jgi:hypothetical protein